MHLVHVEIKFLSLSVHGVMSLHFKWLKVFRFYQVMIVCVKQHTLAAEDMQPVSSTEIRSYLNSMSVSFTEGFTCYVTTCPRHCRRRIKVNELDRLYINCTTGMLLLEVLISSFSKLLAFASSTVQLQKLCHNS